MPATEHETLSTLESAINNKNQTKYVKSSQIEETQNIAQAERPRTY